MKKNNIKNNILLYILMLFLSLSIFSTKWAIETFEFLSFDETLFQLTTPIKSAETSILTSYLFNGLYFGIIFSVLLFFIVYLIFNYISCKEIDIDIKLWKKNISIKLNPKVLKTILKIIIFIITIAIIYVCLAKIGFVEYTKNQFNDSSFIEDNYVNPKDVKITFPEKKNNLIYIYVESLETTYFSEELGGSSSVNLLEPITDLTRSNIYFSDSNKFGGAISVPGTTWTSSAMVAHTAGLPLKVSAMLTNYGRVSSMMEGTITLGDILYENNYKQMIMFGSDKNFGNRGVYFENHGNFEVYDYYTAIEKKKISDDYYVWWGFEDSKLFEFAKEEITNLSKGDQPFNFTLLTANTHFEDGFVESDCNVNFGSSYNNSIYCSSKQINEFINWIIAQPFYEDTTIIIVGDHVSMQKDLYPNGTKRRIYNLFINSKIQEGNFYNREFSTLDFFPTTLASIGVEIEGDRLGLGTNLFSDKKTLMEEMGHDKFNKEVSAYSKYYMKYLFNKEKE